MSSTVMDSTDISSFRVEEKIEEIKLKNDKFSL